MKNYNLIDLLQQLQQLYQVNGVKYVIIPEEKNSEEPQGNIENNQKGETDGYKWETKTWKEGNTTITSTIIYSQDLKEPQSFNSKPTLEELQQKLDIAIEEERYEDAAKYRDQIKDLK